VDDRLMRLGDECLVQRQWLVVDVPLQERVVVPGEDLQKGVLLHDRLERRLGCAEVHRLAHRDDLPGEFRGDLLQYAVVLRAGPVEFVDEDQRRDAQTLQGAHEYARLRLDALDRRDDQDRAVEHAQRALHLGDEVRVARGVDQVDADVADRERRDGGLDRDPTLPFERERVGLGTSVVDAADLVDDSSGVQQPLGQAGLSGVNMRQDPKIQYFHAASCP
jgi:hypothetical protein